MLVKFLPYGKKIKLVRVFGYLLRQVALHGRKRGLKVGDSLSVSLIQVGSKPVEKSITSPIVFPCFSYKEQGFVHIALASWYDSTMMISWYHKQQFEIVSNLPTILVMRCNSLNIWTICIFHEIVGKLPTICNQWSIELIKVAHVLQVGWRKSLYSGHFILQVLTEILVEARAISIWILLGFDISSQLPIEVQQIAIGGTWRF